MTGVAAAPMNVRPMPVRRLNAGKILVAHPDLNKLRDLDEPFKTKLQTIEDTGYGNLLCYEDYGARIFLSSEEEVRAGVKRFVDNYNRMCRMFDEDPKHEYFEVMNWNDLYHELHIVESFFGNTWGYSNNEEYRVDLQFNIYLIENTVGTYFQNMADKVLIIEPLDQYCVPFDFYMEV